MPFSLTLICEQTLVVLLFTGKILSKQQSCWLLTSKEFILQGTCLTKTFLLLKLANNTNQPDKATGKTYHWEKQLVLPVWLADNKLLSVDVKAVAKTGLTKQLSRPSALFPSKASKHTQHSGKSDGIIEEIRWGVSFSSLWLVKRLGNRRLCS